MDTLFFYFLQTHVFFKSACCQNQIVNLILCAVVLGIAGIVFNIVTTNNQQGGRWLYKWNDEGGLSIFWENEKKMWDDDNPTPFLN